MDNEQITSSPMVKMPAITVIIPMYNAAEYVGECLESLLLQTFRNFEVIVVDDCSTDDSVKIVEGYAPKFEGQLQITQTETNSGGGGYIPRNIGIKLAKGEYICLLDADDFLLLTALERLYDAAKTFDADVVYTSVYYNLVKPNDVFRLSDGMGRAWLKAGIEDKTELTTDDRHKIFHELLFPGSGEGNFRHPWSKFVRRDFLIENEIFFPNIVTGGDCIWIINVYAHAKKFLRLPIPLYFYRRYNSGSITRTTRQPEEQLTYWGFALAAFIKALVEISNKSDFLRENPFYCYEALRGGHFEWCLYRTKEAREQLSNQAVYEILYRELSEHGTKDISMPYLFSIIDSDRRERTNDLQTIKNLKKEISQLKSFSACPVISIIIPVYNAEQYIGEALESILVQTFQNFEVIVVDDCSTDSSYKVVEDLIPKFNGRLKLLSMGKNSGCAPAPRNKGFGASRGEYIFFMDSDDTFTKTALEEMYTLAKKYNADVVYCEKYYMSTGVGEDFLTNIHVADHSTQRGPFVNKPTLITNDLTKRLKELSERKFWVTPWQRFVSRKLLAENQIRFPEIIGSDDVVWCFEVLCCAKRFLRVPNMCYIRRMYDESFTKSKKSPNKFIRQWGDITIRGLKFVDNFMSKLKFFQENPAQRYEALDILSKATFPPIAPICKDLQLEEIYNIVLTEFAKTTGENDVLVSFLFTSLVNEQKARKDADKILNNFKNYLTSRIDINLEAKSDFQILSLSDSNATVDKPEWIQKDGVGYVITSFAGKIEFIAKAAVAGRINLVLRGLDMRKPEDISKRLPYWIDYTRLIVNGKTILDKLTPVWHDKAYKHTLNVKADEEIKIEVEWLPHMDTRRDVSEVVAKIPDNHAEKLRKSETLVSELNTALNNAKKDADEQRALVSELRTALDNEKKHHNEDLEVLRRLKDSLTARIDIRLISPKGDFQILSVSDDRAIVSKPDWFQKDGVGYQIQSCVGQLKLIAKTDVDGRINFGLKGPFVCDPQDPSKHLPYWIDYTKLIINDKVVFDALKPAWHDKPYFYNMNVKAGEKITVQVEWLPHRSDA